jgi:8-hydroxy-5-deazaflavin:NADPH oxidoreductase
VKIGFIGAGTIAQTLGQQLAGIGHHVVISNSRGPDTLSNIVERLGVSAATPRQAAARDVVFLAVNWSRIPAALDAAGDLSGRIVIDTNNPLESPDYVEADLGGRTSSEVVADLVPDAHVVKAFNHMTPASYRSGPLRDGAQKLLFHSSDHADAHRAAAAFIEQLGYVAINLGGLAPGGRLHQFPGGPLASRTFVELKPNL